MYRSLAAFTSTALLTVSIIPSTVFAIDCEGGILSHPATASEALAGGIAVGMPVCPADAATGITDASGDAYRFLLTIYTVGTDSAKCGPNMATEGITKLNAAFAIRLAALLKAAQTVGPFGINSAYRCDAAQSSANPSATAGGFVSMHTKGLAVDLIYPGGGTKVDCASPGYKWIAANARMYGIALYDQVHTPVPGECNHLEDTTGISGLGMGSSPFQSNFRHFVSPDVFPPAAITPFTSLSAILSAASILSGLSSKSSSAPQAQPTLAAQTNTPTGLNFGSMPIDTQRTIAQLLLSLGQATTSTSTAPALSELLAQLNQSLLINTSISSTPVGSSSAQTSPPIATSATSSTSTAATVRQLELLRQILVLILNYLISLNQARH